MKVEFSTAAELRMFAKMVSELANEVEQTEQAAETPVEVPQQPIAPKVDKVATAARKAGEIEAERLKAKAADELAKAEALAEAKAKAEAMAKHEARAEANEKAVAEAKAAADARLAEAKAKNEAREKEEAKERAAQRKAQAEANAKAVAEAKAKAAAEEKAKRDAAAAAAKAEAEQPTGDAVKFNIDFSENTMQKISEMSKIMVVNSLKGEMVKYCLSVGVRVLSQVPEDKQIPMAQHFYQLLNDLAKDKELSFYNGAE
ncbi:hypothetical protein PM116P6_00023 [Parabacteroides phage PM116P6]|nr:hypothetical protein PM116P6_00023 [Parabacteroides phage PM116P6]WAX17642.1 hypothetical protein PM116P7_00027 [Parabacteroides phage PM116P7]